MSSTSAESFARLLRLRAGSEPLRIEVAGSSMGRTIVSGSSVWVSATDRPRWGQIWAFCESGETVAVHRFVGRRDGCNRFWGDGNVSADALVDDAFLIGRVVGIEAPTGGYRAMGTRAELTGACVVGARRLPRRVWWRARNLAARAMKRTRGQRG